MSDFTIENGIVRGRPKAFENVSPNIGQAIFDALSKDPAHIAQIEADSGETTTYEQMKDKSVRCALWLQRQNLNPEDIVVICTDNRVDAYVPYFATFFVDAIFCPWNYNLTPDLAEHCMKLFRPKVIFVCKSAVDVVKNASNSLNIAVKLITFEQSSGLQSLDDIMQQQPNEEVERYKPRNLKGNGDVSAILLTSGSTGYPKGVMHSGQALVDRLYPDSLSLRGKICMWYSTFNWVSAIIYTLTSTFNLSTRLLHLPKEVNIEETCKVIEKYKVNHVFFAPFSLAHLSKLHDVKKYNLSSLDTILTAGSKLSKNVFESLRGKCPNTKILLAYGMTELGFFSHLRIDESISFDSFGFVQFNVEAKIINPETGATLSSNEGGELCLRLSSMMLGYYKNPDETKRTIDQEGWLHTGDRCRYNERGEFFFECRSKEMIAYRNLQVNPVEIEDTLMKHPAVLEVAVVPVPHETDGERSMAFIRRVPGKKVTKEELLALSSELGEHNTLWGGIEFLDELPKSTPGKIARLKLRELAITLKQSSK